MNYDASSASRPDSGITGFSRRELGELMTGHCADCGADGYLLAELVFDRGRKGARILSSNWIYDAVKAIGPEGIARIAESDRIGTPCRLASPLDLSKRSCLRPAEREALADFGHAEVYGQWLSSPLRRVIVLFTTRQIGRVCPDAVARAAILCGYIVELHTGPARAGAMSDRLSERERECLRWVSEGKTTDEVSVILGVSSNTVNSYVSNAIQKMGASNRAMAIATAIRGGLI